MRPATRPGAPPAYWTVAVCPPTVAVTGSTGSGRGTATGTPFCPGGEVWPSPVAYRVTKLPAAAGWLESLIERSAFIASTAPDPPPLSVNSPGAAAATSTDTDADTCPWYCTNTCARGPVTPYGMIAPTWLDEVYS